MAASAHVDDRTILCRVLGRYKMFVDSADYGLAPHLVLDGFWEMWVTEVVARRVRPGMKVADIGANLGYYTVLMADLVGPVGVVHAFEPNPAMVSLLKRNLAVNGLAARVHPTALSDRDGASVELVVPPNEPKNGHIVSAGDLSGNGPDAPLRLQTRRLDSFLDLAELDFLKIDADGSEEAIWRGMAGVLSGSRPMTIVMEFAPARYADPRAFLASIAGAGFSLGLIHRRWGERAATVEQILAPPPTEDRMLLLCR